MDIKIVAARGPLTLAAHLMGLTAFLVALKTAGTAEETAACAERCIQENAGHPAFILSAGGGTSPGTPAANIHALTEAAAGAVKGGRA